MGVRGMNLGDNDVVIGMQMSSQGKDLLIVSEKGMGKRTSMEEFTKQNRGGKGVKCYKITEKTGNVVGMKAVDEDSEIIDYQHRGNRDPHEVFRYFTVWKDHFRGKTYQFARA